MAVAGVATAVIIFVNALMGAEVALMGAEVALMGAEVFYFLCRTGTNTNEWRIA